MSSLIALWLYRTKTVALMTLLGLLIGAPLARLLSFDTLVHRLQDVLRLLTRKLNRTHRSVATRVYRGIALLLLIMIVAWSLGAVLLYPSLITGLLGSVLLIAIFGRGLSPYALVSTWRQAKAGTLTLEHGDILFSDTHGLLRHSIATSTERFAIGVVGSGIWFVVGGFPLMLCYLAVALVATQMPQENSELRAFGWAARTLFAAADIVPRALSCLLFLLASFCVPHAHPLRALRGQRPSAHGLLKLIADLLGISLGGRMVTRFGEHNVPWIGEGTAQVTATHLTGWLWLWAVALVMWLVVVLRLANL